LLPITGQQNINAMAANNNFLYAILSSSSTKPTIMKMQVSDPSNYGVDLVNNAASIDLSTYSDNNWDTSMQWQELTCIHADDTSLWVTGEITNLPVTGSRFALVSFDKSTMQHRHVLAFPASDNVPYAMVGDSTHLYIGFYADPGRIVKVAKGNPDAGIGPALVGDPLVLDVDFNDVRSMALDAANHILYAACNTMPGRMVSINTVGMNKLKQTEFPTGIGHLLASSTSSTVLAASHHMDEFVYVATNQQPSRVVEVRRSTMQVTRTLTLNDGEDKASSMAEDVEHLYVGTYTSPAKLVRIAKKTLMRETAITLGGSTSSAAEAAAVVRVDVPVGTGEAAQPLLFVGTHSNPAYVSVVEGAVLSTDCKMGLWGEWDECSQTCGRGWKDRHRTVAVSQTHGGACPESGHLKESVPCKLAACPVANISCAGYAWGAVSTTKPWSNELKCEPDARNENTDRGTESATHVNAINALRYHGPGDLSQACQCPSTHPYIHRPPGTGANNVCMSQQQCTALDTWVPCSSIQCQLVWDSPTPGAPPKSRIRVTHGGCDNPVSSAHEVKKKCTATGSQKEIPAHDRSMQYKCVHTGGGRESTGCKCTCHKPHEAHCSTRDLHLYVSNAVRKISSSGNWVIQDGGNADFKWVAIGEEITYDCDAGYTLSGTKTRVCQTNGAWSGVPAKCTNS
jgi:hypothetical protein